MDNMCCYVVQVSVPLSQVLPSALLAALELVYLGALPRHTQQQLLPAWKQKISEAVAGSNPAAAAGGDLVAAADRPRFFARSADLGRSSSAVGRPRFQGRWAINLMQSGAAAAAAAPKDSQIVSCLGLPQREGLLYQQIKLAAAAAALTAQCGLPLLVLDPWNLLPELLLPKCRRDRLSAAAAAGAAGAAGGGGGSSSGWELISAWDRGSAKNTQDGVEARDCTTPMRRLLHRLQTSFESGSNVCLQLNCNARTACETAAAAAALHTYVQLQAAAAAAAAENQDDLGSPDSISPGQAGPGSSSSRTLDRSGKSRRRVGSAYSSKSRNSSAASDRGGFAAGSAAAAALGGMLGPLSPRLVIQIVSSEFELAADSVGLCQTMDLAGLHDRTPCIDHHTAQQQQQQQLRADLKVPQTRSVSTGPAVDHLPEYVMKLVLQTAAADCVAAVAAAADNAEVWQQQHDSDDAKLMRRLTQVGLTDGDNSLTSLY